MTDQPTRKFLIVAVIVLAGAGVLGFAGSQFGLLDRLDDAYAEWSLKSRVSAFMDARVSGDLEETVGFVAETCSPCAQIGNMVNYRTMEIIDMQIEDDSATVRLQATYVIALPGFSFEKDQPRETVMIQIWTRIDRQWYWDPGPPPTAGVGVTVLPEGETRPDRPAPAPPQIQMENQ